jgi:CYTH domain-containing protein
MATMAKEVERKFLLASDGWRAGAEAGTTIRQFYLFAAEDRSIRVRLRDDTAILTCKFGRVARERDEFEYRIPVADALQMQTFARGNVIEKTRYRVRHADNMFEVDVFGGALSGLEIAELETTEEVAEALLPQWLGREVTGDAAYYNASLALRGMPEDHR